jgi:hypothetical protein
MFVLDFPMRNLIAVSGFVQCQSVFGFSYENLITVSGTIFHFRAFHCPRKCSVVSCFVFSDGFQVPRTSVRFRVVFVWKTLLRFRAFSEENHHIAFSGISLSTKTQCSFALRPSATVFKSLELQGGFVWFSTYWIFLWETLLQFPALSNVNPYLDFPMKTLLQFRAPYSIFGHFIVHENAV